MAKLEIWRDKKYFCIIEYIAYKEIYEALQLFLGFWTSKCEYSESDEMYLTGQES